MAGLIKTVLSLEHKEIPGHLHFEEPSGHIRWGEIAVRVPVTKEAWGVGRSGRRIAGVSSFGFSGTNAHVIVEEAGEKAREAEEDRGWHLLAVSGRSEKALKGQCERYGEWLEGHAEANAGDVCYTAGAGRTHFRHRVGVVGRDCGELAAGLRRSGGKKAEGAPKVAFQFSGQGEQYVGMGRELYAGSKVYRDAIDRCDEVTGGRIKRLLERGSEEELEETEQAQPVLFAVEWGLYELWKSWGVEPWAVLGHSLGEYVAATVAGVFELEAGLRLVIERGRLMEASGAGRMAAVLGRREQVEKVVGRYRGAEIAAVNGAANVVVSGEGGAVVGVVEEMRRAGVESRWLRVKRGFHSALMDEMLDEFEARVREAKPQAPRMRVISNVTGEVAGGEMGEAGYWRRQTRGVVEYARGVEKLRELGCGVVVEVGPGAVLSGLGGSMGKGGVWVSTVGRGRSEWERMLAGAGVLYENGVELEWGKLEEGKGRRKVSLPGYAFQRERYWIEGKQRTRREEGDVLAGERVHSALKQAQFRRRMSEREPEYVKEHRIGEQVIVPGTMYVEMGLSAGRGVYGKRVRGLRDVRFLEALELGEEERDVETIVEEEGGGGAKFQIYSSKGGGGWRLHAEGEIRLGEEERIEGQEELGAIQGRCREEESKERFYEGMWERGLRFGERFRRVERVWKGAGEALGEIRASEGMHPAVLDGCLQVCGAAIGDEVTGLYLPVGMGRVEVKGDTEGPYLSHARIRSGSDRATTLIADVTVFDQSGAVVARLSGVEFSPVGAVSGNEELICEIRWQTLESGTLVEAKPRSWIAVGENAALTNALAGALTERGHTCRVISSFAELAVSLTDTNAIVYCAPPPSAVTGKSLLEPGLMLVQELISRANPPAMYLVTTGSQAIRPGEMPYPMQALLWGFGATIALERPELGCVRIDLDPADPSPAASLAAELCGPRPNENQIGIRAGAVMAARLIRRKRSGTLTEPGRICIQAPSSGDLNQLVFARSDRTTPGAGEIEIHVRASGVNFRDVLAALGMYPGAAGVLGGECSGVVHRVGPGVASFRPGDEVMAFVPGGMSDWVTVLEAAATGKPSGMSFAEAAAMPVAHLTALYGLLMRGRLRKGESVLIHAAAGGVGLAAVQVAQRAGAVIFATAGTAEKRQFLQDLGVPHVFDSRTTSFCSRIHDLTLGAGVDVVLNSLAGEFIPASLSALSPTGRFIELGKRGILTPDEFAVMRPRGEYHAFDLGTEIAADARLLPQLWTELHTQIVRGMRPLRVRAFDFDSASAAFHDMAAARHIGKLTLTHRWGSPIRPDATYLVTGGCGAVGLHIVEWLVAGAPGIF